MSKIKFPIRMPLGDAIEWASLTEGVSDFFRAEMLLRNKVDEIS